MSQGRFLFVPDTVPPKMFMFIGFVLPNQRAASKMPCIYPHTHTPHQTRLPNKV